MVFDSTSPSLPVLSRPKARAIWRISSVFPLAREQSIYATFLCVFAYTFAVHVFPMSLRSHSSALNDSAWHISSCVLIKSNTGVLAVFHSGASPRFTSN